MKMVKQLGPYELPSMLAFMPDEERRAFMKRVRPPQNPVPLLRKADFQHNT
jgi:hypothetical protein